MIKVAILYICTGKYNQFFEGFYDSCEKFFLRGIAELEYFVFTDDKGLSHAYNVHIIEKVCEGFPADSLFRFDMFMQIKSRLVNFDYIYFFNSNTEFRDYIGTEILPTQYERLIGALWPRRRRILNYPAFYPYERNRNSLAYIAPFEKEKYFYYMGGINGGFTEDYMRMISVLSDNIRSDYSRGIIAVAHDESHINKYFRTHKCKILPIDYCCPEEWCQINVKYKIIFRDKVKIDSYFNKGRNSSFCSKLEKGMRILYRAILWYL